MHTSMQQLAIRASLLALALGTTACTNSGFVPNPALSVHAQNGSNHVIPMSSPTPLAAPTITTVVNDGPQANGDLQVEILGQFPAGGSNAVSAKCATANPTITKRLDSANRIVISFPQLSDSCAFTVQNSGQASVASNPVSFASASGQAKLRITGARIASSGTTSSKAESRSLARVDIILDGDFYGQNDTVWAMCDSGQYMQIEDNYVQLDSTTELRLSIATPVNFNTCQFYVQYGEYQGPRYSSVAVTEVSYVAADPTYSTYSDFQLVGRWYEAPEVYVSCDSQEFVQIDQTDVYNWDGSSARFRMESRGTYTSCEAYAYAGGVWSDIVYF